MNLKSIKQKLVSESIFLSDIEIQAKPTVIGYEKKFKWSWFATQLNTFIVVSDYGNESITPEIIERHLTEAFDFASRNYTGWPRGLQSGVGVISVLISSNVSPQAKAYCRELKSGKKWAGFTIPVTIDSSTNEVSYFEKNPVWGRIYYPHFKSLINSVVGN
jgi:hypothetical protein